MFAFDQIESYVNVVSYVKIIYYLWPFRCAFKVKTQRLIYYRAFVFGQKTTCHISGNKTYLSYLSLCVMSFHLKIKNCVLSL